MNLGENPYVGPRPFTPAEKSKFFGREHEQSEVVSLLLGNPVVLLYSRSGAGKSSMLNAGVIPMLKQEGVSHVVRTRVGGRAEDSLSGDGNIFLRNLLASAVGQGLDDDTLKTCASVEALGALLCNREYVERPESLAVLIIDQFEEIFHQYPEHWEARDQFIVALAKELNDRPRLRILLAIREEFVAFLERYSRHFPESLRARFRLERLKEDAAVRAIKQPLPASGPQYADGVAEELARQLRTQNRRVNDQYFEYLGEFVEPTHLQLVCANIWQKLDQATGVIDLNHIDAHASLEQALREHYESTLNVLTASGEIKERELREWFGTRLIRQGARRDLVLREEAATGGLENRIVDELERCYLIRSESRDDNIWVEISHERFVRPILESNQVWRAALYGEEKAFYDELQQRIAAFATTRDAHLLLEGKYLQRAQEIQNSGRAKDLGIDEELAVFIKGSIEVQKQRRTVKSAAALLAVVVVSIVSVLVNNYAINQDLKKAELKAAENEKVAKELARENIELKANRDVLTAEAEERSRAYEAREQLLQDYANKLRKAEGILEELKPAIDATHTQVGKLSTNSSQAEVAKLKTSVKGLKKIYEELAGAAVEEKKLQQAVADEVDGGWFTVVGTAYNMDDLRARWEQLKAAGFTPKVFDTTNKGGAQCWAIALPAASASEARALRDDKKIQAIAPDAYHWLSTLWKQDLAQSLFPE